VSSDGHREGTPLVELVADLDEEGALASVREMVDAGVDPMDIIDHCQRGLQRVGERYEDGGYFISGLIMAGEIFREVMDVLGPRLQASRAEGPAGTVLLCTVRGDIHDLGKDILELLLCSRGFEVHDLGVDVAEEEVVRSARKLRPDVVGLSGLLTAAFASMKTTIEQLRPVADELGRPLPVIIGGGPVSEQIREWTGADLWAPDAVRGVDLIAETIAAGKV